MADGRLDDAVLLDRLLDFRVLSELLRDRLFV